MKNPALIIAPVAVAFGVFAMQQRSQVAIRDAQIAELRAQLSALRMQAEKADTERKQVLADAEGAIENAKRLTTERDDAISKAATTAPAEAPAAALAESKPANFAKGLAEMFKGDEGKKMLRSQSEFGARMIYGDFIKGLDAATSDAVMSLLADRQTAMAMAGMEAMSAEDPKAASAKVAALKADYDKKLSAMIGDQKMKELEGYERTAGDRMMFSQVESQFATAGTPLSAEQRTSVLSLMQQERLKFPPSALERGNENPAEAMQAIQDEKIVAEWLAREEQLNAAVVAQSSKILSPDQVLTLEKSFKQMGEMKKFGVKMWQNQQKK